MPTETHPTGEKIPEFLISLGKKARAAAARNAYADPMDRDRALECMLESLKAERARILAANEKDMAQARENGMSPPLLFMSLLVTTIQYSLNIPSVMTYRMTYSARSLLFMALFMVNTWICQLNVPQPVP